MKYKIADLIVEYEAKYDTLKTRSEKYRIDTNQPADFEIVIEKELFEKQFAKYRKATFDEIEYILTTSLFYPKLLNYQACHFHASAVVVDNEAYLFSADCGTGKSTHTGLWLTYLADKNPYILNDDKPALRIFEDGIYAYGTPFSGKHDMSENKKVKVKGICFIEQAKENSIRKIDANEAINLFFKQTITYLNKEEMLKLLDIMEVIIQNVPFYKMGCNISEEAVRLSYETMRGVQTNEN